MVPEERMASMTRVPKTEIRIHRVSGPKDLARFIRLPWKIYAHDPYWVPPLIRNQKKILDRNRHPFHRHGVVEYFLALQGSEIVGRIAAILNPRYNEYHDENTGFFGFFESVDNAEVALKLLQRAEDWLTSRGAEAMVGPLNFTTNDESHSPGILIEGFDSRPFVMMGHNPRYYPALLQSAGFRKAKDLFAYRIPSNQAPERIAQAVSRIENGIAGLRIRNLDMRRLEEEVATVQEIYNSSWEQNWGFVPLTEAEIGHLAQELRPLLEPRYSLIASVHGRPAGFCLTLPDFNQALRHLNGRLGPVGFLRLLRHIPRIDRCRVVALGLKRKFRGTGIDAIFYLRTFRAAQSLGHTSGESSWILEDNWKMRRALEKVGAEAYKTYRIYQKDLQI